MGEFGRCDEDFTLKPNFLNLSRRWRWLLLGWNLQKRPGVSGWPAGGAHLISPKLGEGELEAQKRSVGGLGGEWANEGAGSRDRR